MDTSVAELTFNVAVPEMVSAVAVMVVEPVATALAKPNVPSSLLMTAVDVLDDSQVTEFVIFWVESSEKVPMAINCSLEPAMMESEDGETAIETRFASVTIIVV